MRVGSAGGTYYDAANGVTYTTLHAFDDVRDRFFLALANHPVDEPTVGIDLNGDGGSLDLNVPREVRIFRNNLSGGPYVIETPKELYP